MKYSIEYRNQFIDGLTESTMIKYVFCAALSGVTEITVKCDSRNNGFAASVVQNAFNNINNTRVESLYEGSDGTVKMVVSYCKRMLIKVSIKTSNNTTNISSIAVYSNSCGSLPDIQKESSDIQKESDESLGFKTIC